MNKIRECVGASTWWLAMMIGGLVASPAWSAPFEVSSAHVGTHTTFQTEAEWAHTPDSNHWKAPKLKVEVPLIPRLLEVKLSDSYQIRNDAGSQTQDGWGDVEAELKWAPIAQRNGSPVDLAVEPKLFLPTGDEQRGLGAGATRVALPLMVARRVGRAQFTGEVEYTHGFDDLSNELEGGLLGTWQTLPQLVLGAEIYAGRKLVSGETTDVDANVGFKWEAFPHWEIDALVGQRLNRSEQHAKLVLEYAF